MTHSYIVFDQALIARIPARSSGQVVKFSYHSSKEAINASRELNLIGAHSGIVRNGKKWNAVFARMEDVAHAKEVNPGEFLLS